MTDKKGIRTRCYYTDYINHMIRFYITCPEVVKLDGLRRADVENWLAVQRILHGMPESNRNRLIAVYGKHRNLLKAVDMYCAETGESERNIWFLINGTAAAIARQRGLI